MSVAALEEETFEVETLFPRLLKMDKGIWRCNHCCRSNFTSRNQVLKHQERCLSRDEIFPCNKDRCPFVGETMQELDDHLQKSIFDCSRALQVNDMVCSLVTANIQTALEHDDLKMKYGQLDENYVELVSSSKASETRLTKTSRAEKAKITRLRSELAQTEQDVGQRQRVHSAEKDRLLVEHKNELKGLQAEMASFREGYSVSKVDSKLQLQTQMITSTLSKYAKDTRQIDSLSSEIRKVKSDIAQSKLSEQSWKCFNIGTALSCICIEIVLIYVNKVGLLVLAILGVCIIIYHLAPMKTESEMPNGGPGRTRY